MKPAGDSRTSIFTRFDDGSLSFQDYQQGHPGKALLGLNGIMTAPRFFTFLLWLTNSQFALSQAQRRLLAKVATAAFPVRNAMQILRCRFSGVLICLLSPGVQVLSLQPSISNCGMLDAAWPTVCCAALCFAVLCCALCCVDCACLSV